MKIEFTIKGIVLNELDMYDIKQYYEAARTAERILDEFDIPASAALQLGYQVRKVMAEYGGNEDDVINEVMNTRKGLWQC